MKSLKLNYKNSWRWISLWICWVYVVTLCRIAGYVTSRKNTHLKHGGGGEKSSAVWHGSTTVMREHLKWKHVGAMDEGDPTAEWVTTKSLIKRVCLTAGCSSHLSHIIFLYLLSFQRDFNVFLNVFRLIYFYAPVKHFELPCAWMVLYK